MGPDAKIKPLPPLTSLRFFAAASIVIMHSAGRWGMPPLSSIHFAVGVDLFFILSGFILAYNYRSMPSLADAIRVIGYRIARIWPLHLVTLAAAMLFFADPANPYFDPARLWATIPMVQAWLGNGLYALHGNAVSWTISVELGFYLLFPLFIILPTRWLLVATALLSVATIIWAAMFVNVKVHTDAMSAPAIMRFHPGSYIVQFAAGMIACRLFLQREWRMPFATASILEAVATALAVFFFFANLSMFLGLERIWPFPRPMLFWPTHLYAIAFLLPLIFVLAIGQGAISRALRNPAMVFLGEISFATYMCHLIILMALERSSLTSSFALPAYFGLVYLTSAVLYFIVERPAQRMLRRATDAVTGYESGRPRSRDMSSVTANPGAEPR
ncbi:MAG: acyltransferase family protein [Rhizobiaceae bacterium]